MVLEDLIVRDETLSNSACRDTRDELLIKFCNKFDRIQQRKDLEDVRRITRCNGSFNPSWSGRQVLETFTCKGMNDFRATVREYVGQRGVVRKKEMTFVRHSANMWGNKKEMTFM